MFNEFVNYPKSTLSIFIFAYANLRIAFWNNDIKIKPNGSFYHCSYDILTEEI
jgi:hypothetical protein